MLACQVTVLANDRVLKMIESVLVYPFVADIAVGVHGYTLLILWFNLQDAGIAYYLIFKMRYTLGTV